MPAQAADPANEAPAQAAPRMARRSTPSLPTAGACRPGALLPLRSDHPGSAFQPPEPPPPPRALARTQATPPTKPPARAPPGLARPSSVRHSSPPSPPPDANINELVNSGGREHILVQAGLAS